MIEALALFGAFLVTSLFATSFVPSLPEPLNYLPLIMMTGLLVLHRRGVFPGMAWLFAGGVVLAATGTAPNSMLPHAIAAIAGALLVEKTFATRSVYALLGLGASTGVLAGLAAILVAAWEALQAGTAFSFGTVLTHEAYRVLMLLVALYIDFVALTTIRTYTQRLFVIRNT